MVTRFYPNCASHIIQSLKILTADSGAAADAQAMLESTDAMNPAIMAGANFIFQAAGWLESGLTIGYEKFVMDAEQCGAIARVIEGLTVDEDQLAVDACREAGTGTNFLGVGHTMRHYQNANFHAKLCDSTPFEQWSEAGSQECLSQIRWPTLQAVREDAGITSASTMVQPNSLAITGLRSISLIDSSSASTSFEK